MNHKEADFDVVIIGGGPGGLSAALWCADLGLAVVLLERKTEIGGQLLRIYNPISNYLGSTAANGRELLGRVAPQIEKIGDFVRLGSPVETIDTANNDVFLKSGVSVSGRFLIIATGVRRRRLNVPGEKEFTGRGIIKSGVLEAPSTEGTVVAVIGGGDAALENAAILSKFAKRVYVIHRRSRFSAREEFESLVRSAGNIETLLNCRVRSIVGKERIEAVEVEDLLTGRRWALPVDIVLVRIGVEPNSEAVRNSLEVDPAGFIVINSKCETSVNRIYAVGDVANPTAPTISGAVGHGATAAKSIAVKDFADLGLDTKI